LSKKTKLFLLTGFLGAGKTTLLKNLLASIDSKPVSPKLTAGVVINEFGKINIDSAIIEKDRLDGLEIVEINNGSIFCKCKEGLFIENVAAFAKMKLDYLFVETSGLSDPANMESIVKHVNSITNNSFDFMGTICIIDALNFLKVYRTLNTVKRQINYSSIIIINKIDLVDSITLEEVIGKIQEINPLAKIIQTSFCKLHAHFLYEDSHWDNSEENSTDNYVYNTTFSRPKVLLVQANDTINKENFLAFIKSFQEKTFRIKGFVKLHNGLNYVDIVGNEIVLEQSSLLRNISEIVIIPMPGYDLKEEIERKWNEIIGVNINII